MRHVLLIGTALAALAITACKPEPEAPLREHATAQTVQTDAGTEMAGAPKTKAPVKSSGMEDIGNRVAVLTALQRNDRLAKDLELDEARKPAEVLQFTGIWPGMTVVELEAGSNGYYTEILNHIVGKNGKVYMQNPPSFDVFYTAEKTEARLGKDGKRLANTTVLRADFGDLGLADASADMITWFLGPHEMFYTVKGTDGMGDAQGAYTEAFRVLKPGGSFVLMDHKAAPGSPETTGGDTHRIDPAHVQMRAEKAGFVLIKTSDILANKADDYSLDVFDDKVRRKTDRFLHMYKKPKSGNPND